MHLKRIQVTHLRGLADGEYDFSAGEQTLRRWVFLPNDQRGAVLVKCVALACTGRAQVEAVYRMCQPPVRPPSPTAELRAELSLHAPKERSAHRPPTLVLGWTWTDRDIRHLKPTVGGGGMSVTGKPKSMIHGMGCLFAGYGARLAAREEADNYDLDAKHRLARFASLFRVPGLLTNPAAFLDMLRHKALYRKHGRKHRMLKRLQRELGDFFLIRPAAWPRRGNPLRLAHPQALALLEEMARRELAVNFNQTLDLRLLTPESAAWLRRIRCQNVAFSRRVYYFSLNDARRLESLRRRYDLMRFSARDNVEFICLYGYDTTLAEDRPGSSPPSPPWLTARLTTLPPASSPRKSP